MSWQAFTFAILAIVLFSGFVWFERSRPSGRLVAAVAALAALGVAGRIVFAPVPNVIATTDIALLAGYSFGGAPGFAVGALSGLISNFWLGQGPWTPWQMVGWGLIGVVGAGLARVAGRRLGRLPLALCAAFAGLAYGALLDLSVMVSYGGEQSLERYLALSARGIPFNIAHAAGNFILMFAAGPALIRVLERYRKRVEFRWGSGRLTSTAACLIAGVCALALTLAPPPAAAASGVKPAEKYLRSAQNKDGGFGVAPDSASNVGMTGWAALGLAAAGINPRDVRTGGNDPVGYIRSNVDRLSTTGDLERTILVLVAAGVDPRDFGGRDLVAELRDRRGGDGSYQKQVNLTAYAILALRAAGVEKSKLKKSAQWLMGTQNPDGGWGSRAHAESEPDSTGSVLQALAVGPGGGRAIDPGVRWLNRSQGRSGGWSLTVGASANSQSTAWAIQGLTAVGKNASRVRNNGNSGFDFLARMQRGSGAYDYSASSSQTPVWVTAQALAAVVKQQFPISEIPREKKEKPKNEKGSDPGPSPSSGVSPSYSPPPSSSYSPSPSFSSGNGGGKRRVPGRGIGSLGDAGQTVDPSGGNIPTPEEDDGLDPANPFDSITSSGEEDAPPEDTFEAPSTPVLLGGLGGLTGLLGAGFLLFRRRLP